jgi:hypothetical protein
LSRYILAGCVSAEQEKTSNEQHKDRPTAYSGGNLAVQRDQNVHVWLDGQPEGPAKGNGSKAESQDPNVNVPPSQSN